MVTRKVKKTLKTVRLGDGSGPPVGPLDRLGLMGESAGHFSLKKLHLFHERLRLQILFD